MPKRTSPIRSILVISALVLGVLAGCSSSGKASTGSGGTSTGGSAASTGGGSSGDTVTIKDFKFGASDLKVKTGTKVTWTNEDSAAHTATSDSAAPAKFDSGNLAKGKTYSFTFDKAGKYPYHCSIHTYMTGTITVS